MKSLTLLKAYITHIKSNIQRQTIAEFNLSDKVVLENTGLPVGVLYGMCKVQLLNKPRYEDDLDIINSATVHSEINKAEKALQVNNLIQ